MIVTEPVTYMRLAEVEELLEVPDLPDYLTVWIMEELNMDRAIAYISKVQRGLWLVEIIAPAEKGVWRMTDEYHTTSKTNARKWANREYPHLPTVYMAEEGAENGSK